MSDPQTLHLPDEIVCMILCYVPPLWRPLASRVCSTWRRCVVELARIKSRSGWRDYHTTIMQSATYLSSRMLDCDALLRPPFLSWIMPMLAYPHNARVAERVARCGLVSSVHLVADLEVRERGARGLLDLLDGNVLANIALYCGGTSTLRRLCDRHGIKRLNRRNMAWAATVAVVARDAPLLQFLARMECPYDITTALALHVLNDTHTMGLLGIVPGMLAYAADIARRETYSGWHTDVHGCLLTLLAVLLKEWAKRAPLALVGLLTDSKRLAGTLACDVRWDAVRTQQSLCPNIPDDDLDPWRNLMLKRFSFRFIRLGGSSHAVKRNDLGPIAAQAASCPAPSWLWGSTGPCTSWSCCGTQALTGVYPIDTTGSATVADGLWIPPLFERLRMYEPTLQVTFRYPSLFPQVELGGGGGILSYHYHSHDRVRRLSAREQRRHAKKASNDKNKGRNHVPPTPKDLLRTQRQEQRALRQRRGH